LIKRTSAVDRPHQGRSSVQFTDPFDVGNPSKKARETKSSGLLRRTGTKVLFAFETTTYLKERLGKVGRRVEKVRWKNGVILEEEGVDASSGGGVACCCFFPRGLE